MRKLRVLGAAEHMFATSMAWAQPVAIAQNVLNVNPASTVATSVGLHPFLRILYARLADVTWPRCQVPYQRGRRRY